MSDNVYVIDERATKRAERIRLALADLRERRKTRTARYKALTAELKRITSGSKPSRPVGASITVPRF